MPESTEKKQAAKSSKRRLFQPGESGNPKGRPPGTRNKFSEKFVSDIYSAWKEQGSEVINAVIQTDPSTFLRVAASLVPKEAKVTSHHVIEMVQQMSDDEIVRELARLNAAAATVDSSKRTEKTH